MKKFFAILLALALTAGLSACSLTESEAQTEEENTLTEEEIQAASESDALTAETERPASETDASLDQSVYEAALACVGLTVEELYDAVGEPSDSQYAASCEEENAEDGMLFYDGFYVWTVKTETEEIVHDVYLN